MEKYFDTFFLLLVLRLAAGEGFRQVDHRAARHELKRLPDQPPLKDKRLRCCCHVPHSRPKQTKNSAQQRPFGSFLPSDRGHLQRLSSSTLGAPPPQRVHSDPAFLQQHLPHPLTGLAVLSVRFSHKCLPHD